MEEKQNPPSDLPSNPQPSTNLPQQPPPYTPAVYPDVNQQQPQSSYPAQSANPSYLPNQVIEHIIIVDKDRYGPLPTRTECPMCNNDVVTEISHEAGSLAWLLGIGCCLIGGVICCVIPLMCLDSTRDVIHSCPVCKNKIAIYKRL